MKAELSAVLGPGVVMGDAFGVVTADVPGSRWVQVATALRDTPSTAMVFFDWLSAYDDSPAGYAVVARVYSPEHRAAIVLRTIAAKEAPAVDSLTGVWPGANWSERETWEMFGIDFTGHPNLVPLLLPEGFVGHPLRKEFGLVARAAKPWPGAKDPAATESRS